MHSTEPRILEPPEPPPETFYKLMRQIYVEQVWRQEQSATNSSGDHKKTELSHIRSVFLALSGARS